MKAPSMVWHPSRQTPAAGQGPLDRLWRGGLRLGDGGELMGYMGRRSHRLRRGG